MYSIQIVITSLKISFSLSSFSFSSVMLSFLFLSILLDFLLLWPQNSRFKCNLSAYHYSAAAAAATLLQSCPTLCDPRDGSPPGSPIPGILQARTLEWVLFSGVMDETEVDGFFWNSLAFSMIR